MGIRCNTSYVPFQFKHFVTKLTGTHFSASNELRGSWIQFTSLLHPWVSPSTVRNNKDTSVESFENILEFKFMGTILIDKK